MLTELLLLFHSKEASLKQNELERFWKAWKCWLLTLMEKDKSCGVPCKIPLRPIPSSFVVRRIYCKLSVRWHLVPGGLAKICLAWIYQQWLDVGWQ
jgi:hypothetical protein